MSQVGDDEKVERPIVTVHHPIDMGAFAAIMTAVHRVYPDAETDLATGEITALERPAQSVVPDEPTHLQGSYFRKITSGGSPGPWHRIVRTDHRYGGSYYRVRCGCQGGQASWQDGRLYDRHQRIELVQDISAGDRACHWLRKRL